MHNPFTRLSMTDAPKLTLRDRAATLKATAPRVMGGKPLETEADQGRRSVVKGSLVVAAIPLSVLASQAMAAPALSPALPHPDQALFDAEAVVLRTKTVLDAAERAAGDASRAFWDTLGPCPAALVVKPWERITFDSVSKPWIKHHPRWAWVAHYEGDDGRPDPMMKVWTAESLRATISNAVLLFGKGGQTPHMILEWRSLLPVTKPTTSSRSSTVWTGTRNERTAAMLSPLLVLPKAIQARSYGYVAPLPTVSRMSSDDSPIDNARRSGFRNAYPRARRRPAPTASMRPALPCRA